MRKALNIKQRILLAFLVFSLAISAINVVSPIITHAENREITVFSWEDYIDESLLDTFKEETGITVNYYTFAGNEEMYNEVIKDPNACNLLCPSEYMILKMQDEDLIKPYTIPKSYKENVSSYIDGVFNNLGFYTDDDKTYACGYMWGTMGFVYNTETITKEDLNSWSVIGAPLLKNKVTIKDSVRDTYIMAVGAVYEEELEALKTSLDPLSKEYNQKLTEIFNRRDDQTIEKVEQFLQNARQNLYGFEVDSGKNDIVTGKIDVNFAWSGDAVAAIDEGDAAGATLGYAVPDEGSNVWFDGFVMTKNTQGQKEQDCVEFLNFICSPESAVLNMDYIGYTSVIASEEVFEYVNDCFTAESLKISQEEYDELDEEEKEEYGLLDGEYYSQIDVDLYGELVYGDEVYLQTFKIVDGTRVDDEIWEVYKSDLKYFFDPTAGNDEYVVYSTETGRGLYAQYADAETINRCAIMDNFGPDDLTKINAMWNRVKLITLSTASIIIIVSLIVAFIVAIALIKYRAVIFNTNSKIQSRKERRVKKGYKIIKTEKYN